MIMKGQKMDIRKSTKNDISEILNIFDIARDYMVTHGNATQWGERISGRGCACKGY